ncbi:MAG: glycosyltransferase [Bacteroidia bacterium]|nr:glycosyltransferase [Bacteroidia bacterium]
MNRRNIIHIISHINRSRTIEAAFSGLSAAKYRQEVILLHEQPGPLPSILEKNGIPVTFITYRGKKDLLSAGYKIYRLLKKKQPDILHCQLFEASYLGLLAGRMAGIPCRLHTRHHSTFHHVYFPRAVKHDLKINAASHRIIAVSENVANVLRNREGADPGKIRVIHHGMTLVDFIRDPEIRSDRMKKYGLKDDQWKIGVISRFTDWKGITYIFEAFRIILQELPEAVLLLGNTGGDKKEEYMKILGTLPRSSWRILEFDPDPRAMYSLFDVFVHIPVDEQAEAFGQVYLESMAAGVPGVFTRSGIATEVLRDGENGIAVPFRDAGAVATAVLQLYRDGNQYQRISRQAPESVKNFSTERMISELEMFYDEL